MSENGWSIIAHGGAKDIADEDAQANRDGLVEAVSLGRDILEKGGSAIDAVEAVVKALENNPAYNAGLYGSVLNEDGKIELDASIMDGATLDIGAIACIEDVQHPVSVARALLKDRAIFLVGSGAAKFARAQGFPSVKADVSAAASLSSPGCDTVGCVARDRHGNIAAATSTGGLSGTRVGRVGDVPLPGCGFYADNRRGGISSSGEGESIARVMLGAECLRHMETMGVDAAAAKALEAMKRVEGEAGIIAISPQGELGWAHNSPHFAVGMASHTLPPRAYIRKGEAHDDA